MNAGSKPLFSGKLMPLTMINYLLAGYTLDADGLGFGAYIEPQNNTGSAMHRYVWFNANNPSDFFYVDITFNIEANSIDQNYEDWKQN